MNIFRKMKFNALKAKVKKLHNLREQGTHVDLKEEIKAQVELAKFYQKHLYDKSVPQAEIYAMECYRAAAALGDIEAQYICGMRLFNRARFWEEWSTSMYGQSIHKKYAAACYEEAFLYLKEAEANGHPLAKRQHGLALVRGWGVPKDIDGGFQLVVDSIEQENAWNRVTKIFEHLGLNTPEFFSMLSRRSGNKPS